MSDMETHLIGVTDGSTLVISGDAEIVMLDQFAEEISRRKLKRVMIIVLDRDQTIESLDDHEMDQLGWIRKNHE
jgi:hypothetical protein